MIELLRDVRVLECTVLPTGDRAGRLLGDLGAQSIKIEQPGTGDTLQDPHLRAREIIHESVHPVAGPFTTVGWPAPVAGQPFDVERHAPTLGEHTEEILAEIGYSADDIHALREQGIV